jgi:hypothetical protein
MKFNVKKVLPKNPAEINGATWVRVVTAIYLGVMVGRSAIHLFSSDGGANSIAGIDIDVEGGDNIIAIFHQWGAIQLILAVFLLLLLLRYPGFTPLILLTLALDPIMRAVAGQIKPVITEGTPPGESLNWIAFYLIVALFVASIFERDKK